MRRKKWLEFVSDWTRRELAKGELATPDEIILKLVSDISEPASKIFDPILLAETVLLK